jgi:hypothetical protein
MLINNFWFHCDTGIQRKQIALKVMTGLKDPLLERNFPLCLSYEL